MKILHLMLACFYIDNYSYQENLLPKYHKLRGHDVEIVASLFTFDENGKGKWMDKGGKYTNEYGIPVTRLEFASKPFSRQLRLYKGLMNELERISPDVIFIHGVQFGDVLAVAKYLKSHSSVKAFADNHSDYGNSAKNWVSENIQHKIIWRHCAKKLEPFVERFYGVLPARVDFLRDVYRIPKEKTELLIMGADDERVAAAKKENSRKKLREKYGIADSDILLMTAGKIDGNKKQVLNLMKAAAQIKDERVRLLVFGTVVPELKEEFELLVDGKKIIYGGWLKTDDTYKSFLAADLLVFPGLHSVYWEQAVGCGCPCLFKKIEGFAHIDCGGNCAFLKDDGVEGIKSALEAILDDPAVLVRMKRSAAECMDKFSYSVIAEKSIAM